MADAQQKTVTLPLVWKPAMNGGDLLCVGGIGVGVVHPSTLDIHIDEWCVKRGTHVPSYHSTRKAAMAALEAAVLAQGVEHPEVEALKAHLDPEAHLVHAGKPPGQKTGFEFAVSSPIVRIIANHMAAMLQAHGAENYVEMGFTHDKLGPLTLVVQRDSGDTPARKVAERDAEIERLRKALGSARELIAEIREQDFESFTVGGDPASMDEAEAGWIEEYDAVLGLIDEVLNG